MDMSSPTSNGPPVQSSAPKMASMPGMSTTFSSNTHVTLWFAGWTTNTTTTYVLTIIFLFSLGLFNRFLGAVKSQLERMWSAQRDFDTEVKYATKSEAPNDHSFRGHVRQWSRALRTPRMRLEDSGIQETEPLSPLPSTQRTQEKDVERRHVSKHRGFWVANAPWSPQRDTVRAVLEFTRAFIGYVLYEES